MKRFVTVALLIAMASSANAQDVRFWLSDVAGGTPPGEVVIDSDPGDTGTLYVYAQLPMNEADPQLLNVSLDLVPSVEGVVQFDNLIIDNPVMGQGGFPPEDVVRFEFVNDAGSGLTPTGNAYFGFSGFSVTNEDRTGVGIGPGTGGPSTFGLVDPYYDAGTDSWQLASVDYEVLSDGQTVLGLGIGANGLNFADGRSADVTVFIGLSDQGLNGESGRGDPLGAGINLPEPGSIVLLLLGSLGLALVRRRKA